MYKVGQSHNGLENSEKTMGPLRSPSLRFAPASTNERKELGGQERCSDTSLTRKMESLHGL